MAFSNLTTIARNEAIKRKLITAGFSDAEINKMTSQGLTLDSLSTMVDRGETKAQITQGITSSLDFARNNSLSPSVGPVQQYNPTNGTAIPSGQQTQGLLSARPAPDGSGGAVESQIPSGGTLGGAASDPSQNTPQTQTSVIQPAKSIVTDAEISQYLKTTGQNIQPMSNAEMDAYYGFDGAASSGRSRYPSELSKQALGYFNSGQTQVPGAGGSGQTVDDVINQQDYGVGSLDDANAFGFNQAKGLYNLGSTVQGFGSNSVDAQNKIQSLANQGSAGTQEAIANNRSMMGATDPNQARLNGLQTNAADPYAARQNSVNQYGEQIGSGFNANPYASQIANSNQSSNIDYSGAAGANPYTSQIGGAFQSNPFQNDFRNQADWSNPYQDSIGGQSSSNPYQSAIAGTANLSNPFLQGMQQGSNSNPFLQGFQDFGNMQNTAFGATVDNALNKVSDKVNSQFSLGGRTGSGAHQGVMTENLGNIANQMYSDNFANNAQRQLQSLQAGASTYGQDQSRNLDYLNSGGNLYNQDVANQQNAYSQAGDMYNTDQQFNLNAQGMAADLAGQGQQQRLSALQSGSGAFADSQNQQLNFLNSAGSLSSEDRNAMLQALQMQDNQFNANQSNNLNYLNSAGNLYGQDQQNQLNYLNTAGNFANQDFANQMQAMNGSNNIFQQNLGNTMDLAGMMSGMYNQDMQRQQQAIQMAPGLDSARYNDANQLQMLGQTQDAKQQQMADYGWNNLEKYMNTVQGIRPPAVDNSPNTWDKVAALTPLLSLIKQ